MGKSVYKTPESNLGVGEKEGLRLGITIKGTAFSVISALLYFGLNNSIPQFEATFGALSSDLPLLTQLAIKLQGIYIWLAWVSVVLLSMWLVSLAVKKYWELTLRLARFNFYVSLVVFVVVVVSMYLPIFSIGNEV